MELKLGNGCWPDLISKVIRKTKKGSRVEVADLTIETAKGHELSLMFRVDLDDDTIVIGYLDMEKFFNAAHKLRVRHGKEWCRGCAVFNTHTQTCSKNGDIPKRECDTE